MITSKKITETGAYQVGAEKHGVTDYQIEIITTGTATDEQLFVNLENAVMVKVEYGQSKMA